MLVSKNVLNDDVAEIFIGIIGEVITPYINLDASVIAINSQEYSL